MAETASTPTDLSTCSGMIAWRNWASTLNRMGVAGRGAGTRPERERVTIDGVDVEIRRSDRRRRTISGRHEGEVIVVMVPAQLSARAERDAVRDLVRRINRKSSSARNDEVLTRRAQQLQRTYLPGAPAASSIRWVANMTTRWGSCSTADGSIRLSDVMTGMPQYVIDAVLLHELAHLIEPGHGPRFQQLVRQNPQHDLAEAYLAGASYGAHRSGVPATPEPDED